MYNFHHQQHQETNHHNPVSNHHIITSSSSSFTSSHSTSATTTTTGSSLTNPSSLSVTTTPAPAIAAGVGPASVATQLHPIPLLEFKETIQSCQHVLQDLVTHGTICLPLIEQTISSSLHHLRQCQFTNISSTSTSLLSSCLTSNHSYNNNNNNIHKSNPLNNNNNNHSSLSPVTNTGIAPIVNSKNTTSHCHVIYSHDLSPAPFNHRSHHPHHPPSPQDHRHHLLQQHRQPLILLSPVVPAPPPLSSTASTNITPSLTSNIIIESSSLLSSTPPTSVIKSPASFLFPHPADQVSSPHGNYNNNRNGNSPDALNSNPSSINIHHSAHTNSHVLYPRKRINPDSTNKIPVKFSATYPNTYSSSPSAITATNITIIDTPLSSSIQYDDSSIKRRKSSNKHQPSVYSFNHSEPTSLFHNNKQQQRSASNGNSKKGPLALLPSELWLQIFNLILEPLPMYKTTQFHHEQRKSEQMSLYQICLVCESFYHLAIPILWRDPVFDKSIDSLVNFVCPRGQIAFDMIIKQRFHMIYCLDLRNIELTQPHFRLLTRLLSYTPNLNKLGVYSPHLTEDILETIFTLCPNLKKLFSKGSIHVNPSYVPKSTHLNNGSLNLSHQHHDDLHHLGLLVDQDLNQLVIDPMDPLALMAHSQLSALDLNNVTLDSSFAFYMKLKIFTPTNLTYLNLGTTWITDDVVIEITRKNPHLISIWLEECSALTDLSITRLGIDCPNLQTAKLRNCVRVGDAAILSIAKGCPRLHRLGISYTQCTDITLKELSKYSVDIETLFMNDLNLDSEDSIVDFLKCRGKTLQTLAACGNEKLGHKTLVAITQYCPKIRELDITDCFEDEVCPFSIEETEQLFDSLVTACPKLETLVVDGIEKISPKYRDLLESRYCLHRFWLEPPSL